MCWLGAASLNAQRDSTIRTGITFNLFTPVFNQAPRYTFGVIQPLAPRWSLSTEFGFGAQGLNIFEAPRLSKAYRLREFRFQVLYALKGTQSHESGLSYFGLEFASINHKDKYTNRTYMNQNMEFLDFDTANYQRTKNTINFQIGYIQEFIKGVSINASTGIGVKQRNISFTNVVNPQPTGPISGILRAVNTQGNGWFFNFDFGAKLIILL